MNHIVTIVQYMAIELIIGVLFGIISKEIIKLSANNSSDVQVFPSSEYHSIKYGDNIPKSDFFNIFNLKPKLVIVHYQEDKTIREDFYTFLGNRTSVTYKSEASTEIFWDEIFWNLLGTPIYLCTAVLPSLIGFFAGIIFSFFPSLDYFFTHLFISGFIWGSVVGSLYPLLYRESE